MQNLNFNQASQIYKLSEIIVHGREALKEASRIQNEYRPYLYKMVPAKITYKNKIYCGNVAMAVIATLVSIPPYRIYQSLRRKGNWSFTSREITIYIDNNFNFTGDEIKELLNDK